MRHGASLRGGYHAGVDGRGGTGVVVVTGLGRVVVARFGLLVEEVGVGAAILE